MTCVSHTTLCSSNTLYQISISRNHLLSTIVLSNIHVYVNAVDTWILMQYLSNFPWCKHWHVPEGHPIFQDKNISHTAICVHLKDSTTYPTYQEIISMVMACPLQHQLYLENIGFFACPSILPVFYPRLSFFTPGCHFTPGCLLSFKVYLKHIKEHCKLKKMSIFFNTVPTCGKALTKQHTD